MAPECDLSVVVPAYQEEENLSLLLPRLTRTLDALAVRWEAIVVDAMRPIDNTAEVCARNGCTCIAREGGNAFGDAVRTGIRKSRGERVIFMDADGSHAPEFIEELWRHRGDADVVIASRYAPGGVTENNWSLVLMSRLLNQSYSWILGLKCADVSNSFKLYPGGALRRLELVCDHFDIVEEMLCRLVHGRPPATCKEIPETFKNRMFGESKRNLVVFIASYIYTVVRLRCMLGHRRH
jgi:dolichol-phosphate mannosyltransferase